MTELSGRPGRARGRAGAKRAGERDTAPSQRQLRVGEQVRHVLAEAFLRGEMHDPRLQGVNLTVGEVRMSPDLRTAIVYTTELGAKLRPEIVVALDHAAPWLGGKVARAINLKYAPRIRFVADELYDEAARMERLLREAMATVRSADEESDDGAGRT